jgi:hypothetical protein
MSSSPSIIKMVKPRNMLGPGHVSRMAKKNGAYMLMGKPERKRPLGRPIPKWA